MKYINEFFRIFSTWNVFYLRSFIEKCRRGYSTDSDWNIVRWCFRWCTLVICHRCYVAKAVPLPSTRPILVFATLVSVVIHLSTPTKFWTSASVLWLGSALKRRRTALSVRCIALCLKKLTAFPVNISPNAALKNVRNWPKMKNCAKICTIIVWQLVPLENMLATNKKRAIVKNEF